MQTGLLLILGNHHHLIHKDPLLLSVSALLCRWFKHEKHHIRGSHMGEAVFMNVFSSNDCASKKWNSSLPASQKVFFGAFRQIICRAASRNADKLRLLQWSLVEPVLATF